LDYTFDEEFKRNLELAAEEEEAEVDEELTAQAVEAVASGGGTAASSSMEAPAVESMLSGPRGTWDISHGPRKKGLNTLTMILPAVTRVGTLLVGGGLATTGYAVGKVGETVGRGKAVDSRVFQAGFTTWLWSNGLVPNTKYEPMGAVGERLAAATGVPGPLKEDDMTTCPIVVSNHVSYIDGLVLASCFKAPKIVAMAGSRKVPVLGKLMEEMEVVFVDRSSGDSKKATLDAIEAHCAEWKSGSRPLLMFPEGGTTNGEGLLDFKKGAFVCGVPVRPVIIVYTGHFDPASTTYHQEASPGAKMTKTSDAEWAAQFMGHFIHSMHVRVLPPYVPSEEEKKDAGLYATNVKEHMDKELQRVRKEVIDSSWKTAAGREDGGLTYKFGDITRVVMRRTMSGGRLLAMGVARICNPGFGREP
jgi:1-acyl-sn-glycerol-3-phosphate acyltransferase